MKNSQKHKHTTNYLGCSQYLSDSHYTATAAFLNIFSLRHLHCNICFCISSTQLFNTNKQTNKIPQIKHGVKKEREIQGQQNTNWLMEKTAHLNSVVLRACDRETCEAAKSLIRAPRSSLSGHFQEPIFGFLFFAKHVVIQLELPGVQNSEKVNKKGFLHSAIFVSYPKHCKPELLLQINVFLCH